MFASLKRLFGRNTQTQERRWYEGPQPVEQLFEEYLASAAATELDKRADELMHGMSDGSIGEEGWREMVELAAQGSMLARYHSAILLIWSGDPSEQEAETSMQLLQELAELNFMPAIAALCALVTPEELVACGQEKVGQEEFGQAQLFISHNLAVVGYMCSRVLVMYLGRIVEMLEAKDLGRAAHPYTRALYRAMPGRTRAGEGLVVLEGELPSPLNPPQGCHFHPRCPKAQDICKEKTPDWKELAPGWRVRCHFAE